MMAKRGFTLVEILIVVVILGILAAIVIPQFTQASSEAKDRSLASDLQSMRSQIELYKCQHNDTPPALATFAAQMTETSTLAGATSGSKQRNQATGHIYGPYLERVPANPFNNSIALVAAATRADVPVAGGAGWAYIAATGEIYANDGGTTTDGVLHKDL
jgi:general secretion pathway protein G